MMNQILKIRLCLKTQGSRVDKDSLSINGAGITRLPREKKKESKCRPSQKWTQMDYRFKCKITKPMEETVRENLDDLGDDFLLLLLLNH